MLTREELEKRIERDKELYTKLNKEKRVVYQRLRRYRNMLYHMNQMESAFNDKNCGDT
jgi:hypothetical protein